MNAYATNVVTNGLKGKINHQPTARNAEVGDGTNLIRNGEGKLKTKVDARLMEITPDMAEAWLRLNTNNRSVRKAMVHRYYRAIDSGEWQVNGQTITISRPDKDGKIVLIDGQHRLKACLQANKSFKSVVVQGVDPNTIHTVDIGTSRSTTDIFKISGVSNPMQTGYLSKNVYIYEHFKFSPHLVRTIRPTPQELVDYYYENQSRIDRVLELTSIYGSITKLGMKRITPGLVNMCYYLFNPIDSKKCNQFMNRLLNGYNLEKDSPILALRNLFISNVQTTKTSSFFREFVTILNTSIIAWNDFIKNKKVSSYEFVELQGNERITEPISN